MNGEKLDAEARGLCGRALDGVGNVMQLEIEKDMLARGGEPACEREPFAAIGEFHADLIEGRGGADLGDEALRLADLRRIEGDDQPAARRQGAHFAASPSRPWTTSRYVQTRAGGRFSQIGGPQRAE